MYNRTGATLSDAHNEPMSVRIQEYWGVVIRRKWVVIACILAGIAIGVGLCLVLPKSYRSSTEILIEDQKIPDEYVKGIGVGNIEARLVMIQQQVMSRGLLTQILEEYKLYEGLIQREGLDVAVEKLRKAIKVETVRSPDPRKRTVEAVNISFADENPMTAMKVTAKLASLFIEENLKDKEQLVTGVSAFLEQELEEAKKALEAQEQAISQYKTKYVGLLPEQIESNLRTLDRLQMELNAANDMLHTRTDKLNSLDRSINEYQASVVPGGVESDGQKFARKDLDPLITRLRQLEQKLTTLRAEWKETYPDITDTKQEILSLKEQLGEKYGTPYTDQDGAVVQETLVTGRKDLPPDFYIYLRELKTQRQDILTELSSLKTRRERLLQLIKETERRVEQTPVREQELMILVRDYENRQKNYQALLDKRLNAHVAVNLEKRQKGEQFRILDPANVPQKPETPNQLQIILAGLLGGSGMGIVLAFGLDHVNPTFRRREDVEHLPGVRVLATVPLFAPAPDQVSTGKGSEVLVAKSSTATRMPTKKAIPHWGLVAKWQPGSIAAEQYRMAATRMVLSIEKRRSTVIEITSALEGEGKTTTVVNLGYTIARDLGRQTLLIDCDLRRPALHHYVSLSARAGLLDLLDGTAATEECVSTIDETSCSVMTVGRSRGELNELGRIEQLREVLPQLRTRFQYIIINTPPVLASATMGSLVSLADEVVMVIKAGSSPQHVVQKAFTLLGLTGEKYALLNGVDEHSLPHYLYGYSMPYGGEPVEEAVSR